MLHLENESVTETLRQKIEKNPLFNPRRAFDILDDDQDGFISIFDVSRELISCCGIHIL